MLHSHIKPKQKVIYWSPTLGRYVVEVVKKKHDSHLMLENGVVLPYKKIVAIQGAE